MMKQLLAELFENYYKDVYTYLFSLCHDASLSEDLASEVFLEVVRSISTFRGQSDIKTWLFTIARRRWYAYLKSKKRQLQTESIHDLYDSEELGSTDVKNEVEEIIRELLSVETPLVRDVVQMRIDGYSYYEIAAKHKISENSARVVYFRAKAKIRKHLEKEGFRYE